jgi:hypothetical protein
MLRSPHLLPILLIAVLLTGCAGPIVKEASYPTRPEGSDKILYSDQKRETVWGGGDTLGDKLFGKDEENTGGGGGIGVNSFLWRASLDTVSFMPVASADPFGGVILTDWYENPKARGERFKINLYILDKQLRADGLRVSVFKQKKTKAGWQDTDVADDMANSIENTVLTRAREMRVVQLGLKQN